MSDDYESNSIGGGNLNQSALLPKNDTQGNISRNDGVNLNNT
jgi:hypothetical protein